MKHFKLFIDESGHPHANHPSQYFVLVGCIIEDVRQEALKLHADQIKFKYWDKTDIVFHSEEIGKKVGDFKQFAVDAVLAERFEGQLLQYLGAAPILVAAAVVNKTDAFAQGWKEETIIRKASESLVLDFLAFLYGNDGGSRGRVVYESSGFQRDAQYLKAFNRYLDPSWEKLHPEFSAVREHLTSITFANKLNHDMEMQLADLFSYATICKFQRDNKIRKFARGSYEEKLILILEKKTLRMPTGIRDVLKKKYYSKIQGVGYFPHAAKKKRTA